MDASMTMTQPASRRSLAAMGKVTVGALVGLAAVLGYAQVIFGGFNPIVAGIALFALVLAGVIAIGWRWAPLLGTLVFALLSALVAMGAGEVTYILAHPGDFAPFSLVAIALPVVVVGLVASIYATVQNFRSAERKSPRGLAIALTALVALVAGALLVSAVAGKNTGAGVSPETLASLPAVTLDKFDGGTVRVKAGQTVALRLVNPDGVSHEFDVDELGVRAQMPGGKDSLALFKTATPGTYTFYCMPHYDKATGEGMHGTLVVE